MAVRSRSTASAASAHIRVAFDPAARASDMLRTAALTRHMQCERLPLPQKSFPALQPKRAGPEGKTAQVRGNTPQRPVFARDSKLVDDSPEGEDMPVGFLKESAAFGWGHNPSVEKLLPLMG